MKEVFEFIYQAKLDNGLYEHEFDHVLVGRFNESPTPNPDEVEDWKLADLTTIRLDMHAHPEYYTYWFRISLETIFHSIPGAITGMSTARPVNAKL